MPNNHEYTLPLNQKDSEWSECLIVLKDEDIERMHQGTNVVFETERSDYILVSLTTERGLKAKVVRTEEKINAKELLT